MSDLKKLLSGYVDDGKRKEIEEYLEEWSVTSLMDVKASMLRLCSLLGFEKGTNRRATRMKTRLYKRGFLRELPMERIVGQVTTKGMKGTNPYIDPKIVGEDVEVNRQKVIDSDEFGGAICKKYGSLNGVGVDARISNFLGVDWNRYVDLKRALFELNLLTEIDINEVLDNISNQGLDNSYLREEVVGDMVEVYREVVIRSDEFREWVGERFDSLYDISGNLNPRFYVLMGVDKGHRQDLKRELFRSGFLTELPVERVVDSFGPRGHTSPYLDSKIVGDKVEEHRELVLGSDYFRELLLRNFPTINDAMRSGKLATLFDKPLNTTDFRTELVRRGFYE
ncbi:hypothetical protein HOD38_04525 [archaeon]|nr:hypothetical protein [archaeon]MBT4397507.1 hypothetical protein [archaeon]MBT4440861.1 hypothetical protein [archaeon]